MSDIVFKDRVGNKLYKKVIPSRHLIQYYARDRDGKILNYSRASRIVKKSGIIKKSTIVSINKGNRYSIYRR
jgi:hypothetical protein